MNADLTVTVVVPTFNGMPWVERCLESVAGFPLVVVDSGSTDGTLELVRERFPEAKVIHQPFRGLAAAWNTGMAAGEGKYALLLNSDAWFVDDGLARLVEFADTRPDSAVVGPRLLNTDGTLQPSIRAFPTPWRLATEYFGLRKLAPRSRALNAFYGGGFDHEHTHDVESLYGAALLVRREAADAVGLFDEDFFMFSEETDWTYRFHQAGWTVAFVADAAVVHVG